MTSLQTWLTLFAGWAVLSCVLGPLVGRVCEMTEVREGER